MTLKIKDKIFTEYKKHNKLIKNVVYVGSLRALQVIMALTGTYFVVRALSKESFGEYHFILSCISILTIFSLKDLNNSIMQAVARGFSGTYRKAVPLAFLSSLIGSLVLVFMSLWYIYQNNNELGYGFAIAAILFPFTHGLMQWNSLHIASEKFSSYFKHNSLALLVIYPLVIIAVLIEPDTLLVPLGIVLIIPAIQNIILTILSYKNIDKSSPIEDGNISYGIKTTLYSSSNIVAMHIDKLLLFYFLSPAILATYIAAERIADLFRNIAQDLSVVLGPKFAKYENYTSDLNRYMKIFVIAYGAAIIIFTFTLLPFLMILLFGEQYQSSIPYAQALLCSVTIGNMATLKFRFIRSKIDTNSFRYVTLYTSLARIIMSIILIPLLGIIGAIISAFLYRIALTLTVNAMIKKNYPLDGIKQA